MKTYRGEHCRNKLFIWLVVAVVIIQFITPASDMVKATDTSSSYIVGKFYKLNLNDHEQVSLDLVSVTETDSDEEIITVELAISEDVQPLSLMLVMQDSISPINLNIENSAELLVDSNYKLLKSDALPVDYFGADYHFYEIFPNEDSGNSFVFELKSTGMHAAGDLVGVVFNEQNLVVIDQSQYLAMVEADEPPKIDETATEETQSTEPVETEETTVEETQSTEPVETEETTVEETQPTEPVETEETTIEETQPTEPVETEETTVEETQPTEPVVTEETTAEETQPTEPVTTEETKPKETEVADETTIDTSPSQVINNQASVTTVQPDDFFYEDEQIIIRAEISDSSLLPIGTEFVVFPIVETNSKFNDLSQTVEEQFSQSVVKQLLYDISFVSGMEVIQPPEQAVRIIIELQDQEFQNALQEEYSLEVVHIAETETEVVNAEVLVENEEIRRLEFAAESFSPYSVVLLSSQLSEGKYGNYNYSYNNVKNSFISDETYAKYRNDNNTLGIAGNFHIVAFNTATLKAHTNGNVLANKLFAGSNFGTNKLANELSYIVNYAGVHGTSASSDKHTLVIGDSDTITLVDNDSHLAINGKKLDSPHNLIQDVNSTDSPFIDLEEVELEIRNISSELALMPEIGITEEYNAGNDSYWKLTLENPNSAGYINVTPEQVSDFSNTAREMHIKGFLPDKMGSVIINVNLKGIESINLPKAYVFIGEQQQSVNEVTTFENGKVIWNFINAENTTIRTNLMTGMVIAPGATVIIEQNLNGTVVAENITVNAESHRTDFTGTLIPHKIEITMEKVWEGGAPATPTDISFKLQRRLALAGTETTYSDVEGSLKTLKSSDENQPLTWVDLPSENNENKAYEYRVVELTDLQDYEEQEPVLIPEKSNPYLNYYRVVNRRVVKKPMFFYINKVNDQGNPLSSGEISFILEYNSLEGNSKSKKITYNLSAIPSDSSGGSLGYQVNITEAEWPAGEYTLREIRAPAGFVLSEKLYGIKIDYENRLITLHDPPDGNKNVLYSETDGEITTNRLTIANHRLRLPETGGPGIKLYLVLGALLMTAALILKYKNKTKENRTEKLQQVKEGKEQ